MLIARERTGAALAVVVQHAGDEFFTRSALARDHDRQFGLRQACERT